MNFRELRAKAMQQATHHTISQRPGFHVSSRAGMPTANKDTWYVRHTWQAIIRFINVLLSSAHAIKFSNIEAWWNVHTIKYDTSPSKSPSSIIGIISIMYS